MVYTNKGKYLSLLRYLRVASRCILWVIELLESCGSDDRIRIRNHVKQNVPGYGGSVGFDHLPEDLLGRGVEADAHLSSIRDEDPDPVVLKIWTAILFKIFIDNFFLILRLILRVILTGCNQIESVSGFFLAWSGSESGQVTQLSETVHQAALDWTSLSKCPKFSFIVFFELVPAWISARYIIKIPTKCRKYMEKLNEIMVIILYTNISNINGIEKKVNIDLYFLCLGTKDKDNNRGRDEANLQC